MGHRSNVVHNRRVELLDERRHIKLIVEFIDGRGLIGTLIFADGMKIEQPLNEFRLARDWTMIAETRLRMFSVEKIIEMGPTGVLPGKPKIK